MLRLGLGVVLIGLIAATHAAEPEGDFFAPKLNLPTAQIDQLGTNFPPSYQLSTSVVLIRPSDTAHIGLGFDSTYRLYPVAQTQPETIQAINLHWQQAADGDHILLRRLLHLELKGEQVNVEFHPHKVLIGGERFKITFQPQSTLIEGERLKILLQSHSATMLWNKAF